MHLGDHIVTASPSSGSEQTFTIVGIVKEDWSDNGLLMGRDAAV